MSITDEDEDTLTFSNESFLDDFRSLSAIGATPGGGVERQAGTPEDHQTKKWLTEWLTGQGFEVRLDRIGNQFGMFEFKSGAPYVLLGSHLDSQPLAGRYDGALGVLTGAYAAARVVARAKSDEIEPQFNIAVANWFNEEGGWFKPSLMGSMVFTGKMDVETALAVLDPTGASVREMIDPIRDADYNGPAVSHYAEIHIEQGPVLERANTTIGLVDGAWVVNKYDLEIHGEQSHTGATVMEDRRDALYGASLIIVAVRELVDSFEPGLLHTSASEIFVYPNSSTTVARDVHVSIALRSPERAIVERATEMLAEKIREAEQKAKVSVDQRHYQNWGLASYQPEGVELARACAEELNLSYRTMPTVAGHDSTNFIDSVPTIMLFVPSVDGISHNEGEFTRDKDCCAGVDLMTLVAERLVTEGLETSQ